MSYISKGGVSVTNINGVEVYRINHGDWTVGTGVIYEHKDYDLFNVVSCYVMMQGDKMTTFPLEGNNG